METSEDVVCCPKFNPEPWDDKIFEWNNKLFVKSSVLTFFYMPVNFGMVMKKLGRKIMEAGADWSEGICLSDHTSKWNMDLYVSVDKPISSLHARYFTGKFYSRVYEGPFRDSDKWFRDFNEHLAQKGYVEWKIYAWYTTCPKCAKKYGKNYVVMMAELD